MGCMFISDMCLTSLRVKHEQCGRGITDSDGCCKRDAVNV
jgi:hypothetical protein